MGAMPGRTTLTTQRPTQDSGRHIFFSSENVRDRLYEATSNMKAEVAAAVLIEQMIRDAYSDRAPGQMRPLQWSILRCLARTDPAVKSQSWIARFLGITAAPVSRAVHTLERRGLVVLRRRPEDARQTEVVLTDEGHATLGEDPILKIARRFSRLDEEDKIRLKKLIAALALEEPE